MESNATSPSSIRFSAQQAETILQLGDLGEIPHDFEFMLSRYMRDFNQAARLEALEDAGMPTHNVTDDWDHKPATLRFEKPYNQEAPANMKICYGRIKRIQFRSEVLADDLRQKEPDGSVLMPADKAGNLLNGMATNLEELANAYAFFTRPEVSNALEGSTGSGRGLEQFRPPFKARKHKLDHIRLKLQQAKELASFVQAADTPKPPEQEAAQPADLKLTDFAIKEIDKQTQIELPRSGDGTVSTAHQALIKYVFPQSPIEDGICIIPMKKEDIKPRMQQAIDLFNNATPGSTTDFRTKLDGKDGGAIPTR